MSLKNRISAIVVAFSLANLFVPAIAHSLDKKACVVAYEAAQTLKKEGKLKAARDQALLCAEESCPGALRDDCTSWAVELEKNAPTIVLSVTGPDGEDLTDVLVTLDGEKLPNALNGKAVPLDPGSHKILFTWAKSKEPVELTIVAREGERNRAVKAKFTHVASGEVIDPTRSVAVKSGESKKEPDPAGSSPIPTMTYVLGGLGIVGLGMFGTFGLMGLSKKGKLDDRGCKPSCPSSDVDAVKTSFLVADISLGVGIASLGVATVLLLTRGPATKETKDPVALDVLPLRGGGFASFSLSF